MKKILSISVVALLAMAPTMGWARPDNNAQDDATVTKPFNVSEENTELTNSLVNTTEHPAVDYVTARTSTNANNLDATHGYKEGTKKVASIVSNQKPKYNVEKIEESDGKKVAAVSYVKGAYNDLITKVNKVADETSGGDIKVYTTWGANSVQTVALENTTQGE